MRTLIVDGYNVMHAWPRLRQAMRDRGLEEARALLIEAIAQYALQEGVAATVVFDAHAKVAAAGQTIEGVTVVFGARTMSADHVIERLANEAARRGDAGDVVVATGDRLQRALVGAMGAATMSPAALLEEVERTRADVSREAAVRRGDASRAQRVE